MRLRGGGKSATLAPFFAAYNGKASTTYDIGVATSTDRVTWSTNVGNPILSPGSGWESSSVAQPCLVWDGTQFVIFYTGFDVSNNPSIGRATAPSLAGTWTKYGSNPIISHGAPGDPDEVGVGQPVVSYDPADTPKWRMWYHAFPAGSSPGTPTGLTVCYADSSDGITWTKHGVVVGVGTTGAFNDIGTDTGCFIKSGSTWYVFVSGYHNPGTGIVSRGAYCTTTNPASPASYSGLTQLSNYTGNVSAGGRTWQSNQPRGIIPSGDGHYKVFLSVWKPTDSSTILEGALETTSPDLTSWAAPSSLMLPYDSWSAVSAENPSVLISP